LADTQIGDEAIMELAKLPILADLKLFGTKITNNSADYFPAFKKLNKLNISETKINDEGLVKLSNSKSLFELEVYGTTVTDEGIDEFRKQLPGCKVYH
jgi:hypothetical protein